MRKFNLTIIVVVAVCSLAGCMPPPSMDDCASIDDDHDRLLCMNRALYGNEFEDGLVGMVGGAVIGGAIGGLVGGPRGAVIGAGSGAVAGGVAGGVLAYLNYNTARSGGDQNRMVENTESDLEAENYNLQQLTNEYQSISEKFGEEVDQLRSAQNTDAQDSVSIERLNSALLKVERERDTLIKTIQAQSVKNQVYAESISKQGDPDGSSSEQIAKLQQKVATLQGLLDQDNQNIADLNDELHWAQGQEMHPGNTTTPSPNVNSPSVFLQFGLQYETTQG